MSLSIGILLVGVFVGFFSVFLRILFHTKKLLLKDKICIITGASNGIGLELCKKLLEMGNSVVNLDIVHPDEIRSFSSNEKYLFIQCDVSDYLQVSKAFQVIQEKYSSIDILVNNAGVFTGKSLLELSKSEVENVLGTNLAALFWVTQHCLPLMIGDGNPASITNPIAKKKTGYIVNMSSCLGLGGVAKMTDYCASKFGVFGFSESLRQEMNSIQKRQIKVLTVCPYLVGTGMFRDRVVIKFPCLLPTIPTNVVVERILDAIERRKAELWIPWFLHLMPIVRLLPTWIYDFVQNLIGGNTSLK